MKTIVIKNFFKKLWSGCKIWLCLLCVGLVGAEIVKIIIAQHEQEKLKNYPFEIMKHEAELSYNQYKSELVKEVQAYIDSVAPTSSLTGYAIVDCSERYDLDIKFVLAQGQIESNFGTIGMAVKTNSVFNVGAYNHTSYDNINGKFKYKHPDYSIEPYMQLLYRDYITDTKTELDLMAKYVNKNGQRYASNTNYENDLLKVYKSIDKSTKITELQGEMRRYKIISGK